MCVVFCDVSVAALPYEAVVRAHQSRSLSKREEQLAD
jgi:hypothetical protein